MMSRRLRAAIASASSCAALPMLFISVGASSCAAPYSSSSAEWMRRAAYSRASSGGIPAASSARRSTSANVRSTIFIAASPFNLSLLKSLRPRPGPAPEAPQISADSLERYALRRVGDMHADHADAAGPQGGKQRREPPLLQRLEAAATGVGIGDSERRPQGVEHGKMAAVLRNALEESLGRSGHRAAAGSPQ